MTPAGQGLRSTAVWSGEERGEGEEPGEGEEEAGQSRPMAEIETHGGGVEDAADGQLR